jgi:hypothetical protein
MRAQNERHHCFPSLARRFERGSQPTCCVATTSPKRYVDDGSQQSNVDSREGGVAAIDNEVGADMLDDRLKRPSIKNTVIASHFPTVFMVREHDRGEALNQKLEELMLRLEKETTNIASRTSNIGGYHSEANFFSRKEPGVAALRDLV